MSDYDKPTNETISEKAKSSTSNLPEVEKSATLDTVHNDEAIKVLANYTGDETWTDEEERKVLRRIDWKLMPVLCITYGLQYYDKAMFSQAVCIPSWSESTILSRADMARLCSDFEQTWSWISAIDTPFPLRFCIWDLWLVPIQP